jgi:hypothetical protein
MEASGQFHNPAGLTKVKISYSAGNRVAVLITVSQMLNITLYALVFPFCSYLNEKRAQARRRRRPPPRSSPVSLMVHRRQASCIRICSMEFLCGSYYDVVCNSTLYRVEWFDETE